MKAQTAVAETKRALAWLFTAPRPPREMRGRVLDVRPETADSATLVIQPSRGFDFGYRPGQYIGIGVPVDGRWRWRSYSLTSAPRDRGSADSRTVTITVKAMPEGLLSGHLVEGVQPGTVLRLAAPTGNFVMPDPPPASVLFITAGSGITPVMSMLRTLRRRGQLAVGQGRNDSGWTSDVVHLHSVPTADDVMFGAELAELARTHPGYRLQVRATRTEGRVDLNAIDLLVPDWRERQTWACGPEGLLADAERVWAANDLAEHLHLERFAAARTAPSGRGGTVTFARTGRTRTADAATSLLEAGEQAGVQLPFGCRMGICHTCVVGLVDGRVRDLRTGTEYEPGDRVQACVCAADGDCVLDI